MEQNTDESQYTVQAVKELDDCVVTYMSSNNSDYSILTLEKLQDHGSKQEKSVKDEYMKPTVDYKIMEQSGQEQTLFHSPDVPVSSYATMESREYGVEKDQMVSPIPLLIPRPVPCRRGRPPKTSTPLAAINNASLSSASRSRLNSSGEETSSSDNSSSVFLRVPNNTPESQSSTSSRLYLEMSNFALPTSSLSPKSSKKENSHSLSERRRRNRIKNACDELRRLVPTLTAKSDNATVLERTVGFLVFLKENHSDLFISVY